MSITDRQIRHKIDDLLKKEIQRGRLPRSKMSRDLLASAKRVTGATCFAYGP